MSDTDDTAAIPEITLAELLGDDDEQSPVNEMIGVNKNPIKKLMAQRKKPSKSDAEVRAEGREKMAKEEAKANREAEEKRKKRAAYLEAQEAKAEQQREELKKVRAEEERKRVEAAAIFNRAKEAQKPSSKRAMGSSSKEVGLLPLVSYIHDLFDLSTDSFAALHYLEQTYDQIQFPTRSKVYDAFMAHMIVGNVCGILQADNPEDGLRLIGWRDLEAPSAGQHQELYQPWTQLTGWQNLIVQAAAAEVDYFQKPSTPTSALKAVNAGTSNIIVAMPPCEAMDERLATVAPPQFCQTWLPYDEQGLRFPPSAKTAVFRVTRCTSDSLTKMDGSNISEGMYFRPLMAEAIITLQLSLARVAPQVFAVSRWTFPPPMGAHPARADRYGLVIALEQGTTLDAHLRTADFFKTSRANLINDPAIVPTTTWVQDERICLELVELCYQLAACGYVNFDMKANNILLTDDGMRLIDFEDAFLKDPQPVEANQNTLFFTNLLLLACNIRQYSNNEVFAATFAAVAEKVLMPLWEAIDEEARVLLQQQPLQGKEEQLRFSKGESAGALWLWKARMVYDASAGYTEQYRKRIEDSVKRSSRGQQLQRPGMGPHHDVGEWLGLTLNQISYYYLVTQPQAKAHKVPQWRIKWNTAKPDDTFGFKTSSTAGPSVGWGGSSSSKPLVPQLLRFALYSELLPTGKLRPVPTRWEALLKY